MLLENMKLYSKSDTYLNHYILKESKIEIKFTYVIGLLSGR